MAVLSFVFCLGSLVWVVALLGLSVADRILPMSRGSCRVRSCRSGTVKPALLEDLLVSPVLCGLRLIHLTCLTCCKGICRVCGVLFFVFGVLVFVFFGLFAWVLFGFFFGFVSFPLLLARLSSFTDWCTAHRQQFFFASKWKKREADPKNAIWKTRFTGLADKYLKQVVFSANPPEICDQMFGK